MTKKFATACRYLVDNEPWYTVSCQNEVGTWIRTSFADLENNEWVQHIDSQWHINYNVFDVNEKMYMLLSLTWS